MTDKEKIEQLARTIDCVLLDARAAQARGELLPFAGQGALLRIAETGREVAIELKRARVRSVTPPGSIVVRVDDPATVERVARRFAYFEGYATWEASSEAMRDRYSRQARAVLAAIAEGGGL